MLSRKTLEYKGIQDFQMLVIIFIFLFVILEVSGVISVLLT